MSDQPIRNSPQSCKQGYKSLLSIEGEIICNFAPILPYLQHWGDEPRPRFFSGEQIKWRAKKKVFTKNGTLFSRIQVKTKKHTFTENETLFSRNQVETALRCIPESNYWRRCRWRPYSNYWGDTVRLLGGYILPSPGFRHPWLQAKS